MTPTETSTQELRWIKPNVRMMFVPDPDYILFDADLVQSDAQVVAWEADDEVLKEIFRNQIDLHTQNAKDIYRLQREPTPHERQMAKHGVHACDFLASAREMAHRLDMTIHQADAFKKRWFKLHPKIPEWHKRIQHELMTTRTIANVYGYRKIFFGRVEQLLPEAIAWKPQSTTANTIDKALINIRRQIPEIQLLLQVHDAAIGQFHKSLYRTIRPRIHHAMQIVAPYEDPLVISVELKCSMKSWGACKKVPWESEDEYITF